MPQASGTKGEPRRPNIVVILADDMGFSDIGCFGAEIRTPNLDGLARRGVRFTQAYNCARCCPTRASLLTGLYPHQAGVGHMVGDAHLPGYRGFLNDRCMTIAEALRPAGYRTCMSGKWHVGGHYAARTPEKWTPGAPGFPIPVQRGFDEHYGTLAGAANYYDPYTLIRNDTFLRAEGDDYYYTDAISDEAAGMVRRAAEAAQPLFLYVAYTAPHWPLHAPPEDVERYRGAYRGGWDAVRAARHERLRAAGLLDARWPISPRDAQAPPWADVTHKDWEDARMAVYAAQIDRMDQGIGRILAELRRSGLEENTLVLFLSDNGGCAELLKEDGWCEQYGGYTRDRRPIRVGNTPEVLPGPADTYMSYDLPWANASNTPFRLYKHWVHEGGIATPLVVSWPAAAAPGSVCHQPVHVVDILATCLDAAAAAYPAEHAGRAVTPAEGESFLPAVRGEPWQRHKPLFWEHEGNRAVREGPWKLVSRHPGRWELYNMDLGRTELNDLAEKDPARVRRMAQAYDRWAETHDVVPWPPPRPR